MAAGALLALACSGAAPFTPPGNRLAVSLTVLRCTGGCVTISGPVDTLQRGDTAQVRLSVTDTAGGSATVLLRAACAVNVTILGAGATAPTLPPTPTCPDSTTAVSLATPFVRSLVWVVSPAMAAGDYTLRAEIVVDPPVEARRVVRID